MRRSRGRQETSHRGQNNPSQYQRRGGGFEQTGTGYRYDDQQRRFGSQSEHGFGGTSGQERWREPSEQSRYSEGRDWRTDYGQESRLGRGYEGSRSQDWERSQYGAGRGDWGHQSWGRGREYGEEYEPRYARSAEDYGYEQERFGGGEAYEPGDYSYSGRGSGGFGSERDWSSGTRGSYGQGSQQGMYGPSSSHEPWQEGSYQGRERGVTQGYFGERSGQGRFEEGSQQRGSQYQRGTSRGSFAGRGPQGYKRSDERITEDINEALTRDPEVDPTNIQVEVQNGEVTLKGTVSDREAKRRAEDIAESCSGVKQVQNQLRVKREDESESEGSKREKGEDKQRHRVAS